MNTQGNPAGAARAQNVAETVHDIVTRLGSREVLTTGLAAPVVLATGALPLQARSLEEHLPAPVRMRGRVELEDGASFVDYVQRFRGPGTAVWATLHEKGGSFTAVLDWHDPKGGAQWGQHVAVLEANFAREWARWDKQHGAWQGQVALAQFIEENLPDLTAGAEMLELVKTFEATQGVEFKGAVRLDNGDREIAYAVKTGARAGVQGAITIPQTFGLRLPVLRGQAPQEVQCRFRWRLSEGVLMLGYEIAQRERVVDTALLELRRDIEQQLGLTVMMGRRVA